MATGRRNEGRVRPFQTLHMLGVVGDLTDGQLLERFAAGPGEASELAFAVLVERHGAMVRRACFAVLRNEHEAEDASQAAFLVLARKAGTLRVRGSIGPWLHRVAWQTASGVRAAAARRRRHEFRLAGRDSDPVIEPAVSADLDRDAAIHEELARLPEKYRAAVVLCDLEGRTQSEAARILGWPVGTVKSRQARGRRMIRDRLARRGVGLAVAAAAVDSMGRAAASALPTSIGLATGLGASPHVLSLAQGVLRTMFWIKIRSLAAVVLIGLAAGGAGSYVRGSQEAAAVGEGQAKTTPRPDPPRQTEPAPKDLIAQSFAVRKAEARYEIARQNRILAEIDLEEFGVVKEKDGLATFDKNKAAIEGEIKLAEAGLAQAKDKAELAKRLFDKQYISQGERLSADLKVQVAQFTLEQAISKREVLVKFTIPKAESLRSKLAKARDEETVRRSEWDREKAKKAELERSDEEDVKQPKGDLEKTDKPELERNGRQPE